MEYGSMTLKTTSSGWSDERLSAIRREMRNHRLDALLVPRFDSHQGEYCAAGDERLAWATGFKGSAGIAIITADSAQLFIDGRYTIQAREQTDGHFFSFWHLENTPPESWIRNCAKADWKIGFAGRHLPLSWYDRLSSAATEVKAQLVSMPQNIIDNVWADRPSAPLGLIHAMPAHTAGESSTSKKKRLAKCLEDVGADVLIETQPDNIAWLLNVRGSDVSFNPSPQSFVLFEKSGKVEWFVDPRKLPNYVEDFELDGVEMFAPDRFAERIRTVSSKGVKFHADPDKTSTAFCDAVTEAGGVLVRDTGLVTVLKAEKNNIELAGMRTCHIADGLAVTRFLAWLDRTVQQRENGGDPITELEAQEKLLEFRKLCPQFLYPSFTTISASGPHAAMSHYSPEIQTNIPVDCGNVFLIDSGGQYSDGTTDITRTTFFGTATPEIRTAYTLVLQGLISLSTLRFPLDTQGHQIDAFARRALWSHGMDYDHGTGHGVGHCLSVHEGPQRLSKKAITAPFRSKMIVTVEPGFYKPGHFGIRIENLLETVEDGPGFLAFHTLTLAPISRSLIDPALLTREDLDWLNSYHQRVREELSPLLPEDEVIWLQRATATLVRCNV